MSEEKQKLRAVYVPEDLHAALRVHCAKEDVSIRYFATAALKCIMLYDDPEAMMAWLMDYAAHHTTDPEYADELRKAAETWRHPVGWEPEVRPYTKEQSAR